MSGSDRVYPQAAGCGTSRLTLPEFVCLHGRASSLVLEAAPGEPPLWRYWGPRLPDGVVPASGIRNERPLPSFALDHDQPFSVFPVVGGSWFHHSGLLAHRAGQDWSHAFTVSRIDRPDAYSIAVVLQDERAGIEVVVLLHLNPETDCLTTSNQVTNTGEGILDVQWLAAAVLPLPDDPLKVHFWGGRHPNEFIPQVQSLTRAAWRRENRRGLTSHDTMPTAFVEAQDNHWYAAHFAWSGNSVQQIEWLDDGRRAWQVGEWLAPGEVRLAPGESITTPEVIATFSNTGRNGITQNFHTEMRQRIRWPGGKMSPRPVQVNSWEGFYFDHDVDRMKELATAAAALGIERFVLDDGWFHGRNDDTTSLGDWWPDETKYPEGLFPLAEHVTGLGMQFGLWVEPEMVNPDSDLARAHPDWIRSSRDRPVVTGRNQLVLDLANHEVTEYLFDKLSALLTQLPISYLKWDHNRDLAPDGLVPTYRNQVRSVYGLLARLRAAFPDVEIESCAGGGGRIDAGILPYVHRFWASDNIDAVSRVQIQRGFLSVFPPEVMGAHVGAAPAHTTSRSQSMAFRAGVALCGHLGVELDLRRLTDKAREALAEWIALHKSIRDRLHSGEVWMGEAPDGLLWQAHGTATDILLFVIRTNQTEQRYPPAIRLPMLDRIESFQIRPLGPAPWVKGSPAFRLADQEGLKVSGAWLAQSGMPAPALRAEQVALIELTSVR